MVRVAIAFCFAVTMCPPALAQEAAEAPSRPDESTATRLFISGTGRALRRGEATFGVYDFLVAAAQIGITDRFSMGVGCLLPFTRMTPPLILTPKFQVARTATTSTAIGIMHAVFPGRGQRGLVYLVNTTANGPNSGTIGIGWSYAHFSMEPFFDACTDGPSSICSMHTGYRTYRPGNVDLLVGGEHHPNSFVSMVFEGHLSEHGVLPTLGVKLTGERLTLDFAGSIVLPYPFIAPMLDVTWRFGG